MSSVSATAAAIRLHDRADAASIAGAIADAMKAGVDVDGSTEKARGRATRTMRRLTTGLETLALILERDQRNADADALRELTNRLGTFVGLIRIAPALARRVDALLDDWQRAATRDIPTDPLHRLREDPLLAALLVAQHEIAVAHGAAIAKLASLVVRATIRAHHDADEETLDSWTKNLDADA